MQNRRFRYDNMKAARAYRFSSELADVLHRLKLTHKELAGVLGVTSYTVDSWTRGTDPNVPGAENLDRLCELLERHEAGAGIEVAKAAGHEWQPVVPMAQLHILEGLPPTNLPHHLSSFVGREKEKAEISKLLEGTRLLTLLGTGGLGKTRLSQEVARARLGEYRDGVWLVELASLREPGLVAQAAIHVLGVREQGGRSPLEALVEHLRHKQILLLLDNCEHLVEACAELASALLRVCPDLTVLATSRERLGVAGETVWGLAPLSMPGKGDHTPEQLTQYESVRLFVERATAGKLDFALTVENAAAVDEICRRLDGVPLAIELAAACLRFMSAEQVAASLDRRFHVLTGGSRDAMPRHRTLRAAVDWSYDLLSESERRLFQSLSIFEGGCTLRAFEEVCSAGGLYESEIRRLLGNLVDKSLVLAEMAEQEMRYRMLETVREYAAEKRASGGESSELAERHAGYYYEFAQEAEAGIRGPEQLAWLNRLEAEMGNLRVALDWFQSTEEGAMAGLRMVGTLWRFWGRRGYWSEGLERLSGALARTKGEAPSAEQARVLCGIGYIWYLQANYKEAKSHMEQALVVARAAGDRDSIALALLCLGVVAFDRSEHDMAAGYFEESLQLYREIGGARADVASALAHLGFVVGQQGDYIRAQELIEESLVLRRAEGDRRGVALSLGYLGEVARFHGDYARAQQLYQESLAIYREMNTRWNIMNSLHNLGHVTHRQGDLQQARRLLGEAMSLAEGMGSKAGLAWCLSGLAGVEGSAGDARKGAILMGAAENLFDAIGTHLQPVDQAEYKRNMAALHAQLDDGEFAAAWDEGRAMLLHEAIHYARETQG